MKKATFEKLLLGYFEGSLSASERSRVEESAAKSEELARLLNEYRSICTLEQQLSHEEESVGGSFEVRVMERIDELRFNRLKRLYMKWSSRNLILGGGVATLATAMLVLLFSSTITERESRFVPTESKTVGTAHETKENKERSDTRSEAVVGKTVESAQESAARIPQLTIHTHGQTEADKLAAAKPHSSAEPSKKQYEKDVLINDSDLHVGLSTAEPNARERKDLLVDKEASSTHQQASMPRDEKSMVGTNALASIQDNNAAPATALKLEEQRSYQGTQDPASIYYRPEAKKGSKSSDALIPPATVASGQWAQSADSPASLPPPPPPQALLPRRDVGDSITYDTGSTVSRSNEQYVQYSENPRIRTSQEAMSTFGVDVDTASYTNARRYLSNGQLPPAESIRLEEFLNYFSYEYPIEREKPFGLTYEIAPSPLDSGRHLLRLALRTRDVGEATKPWNLVFLVDVSGSMAQVNKLGLVQAGLRGLVGKMKANDRIAIVTYAGDTRVALESTSVGKKEQILSVIDSLSAGGSTNGEGGIRKAYEIASGNFISEGVNRVVLATDGDFNVGISSHEELISLIEDRRKSGVALTTLGVGTDNIHDGTLEQLANKGNGNYFYLDSLQEARRVLEDKVLGTIETVAKDVKLQVEFNPAHVAEYRLIGYDNRKLENHQFNDDTIDSGEIGSGHEVTALYELVLTSSPIAGQLNYRYKDSAPKAPTEAIVTPHSNELGFLKIRYKAPEGTQSQLLEFTLSRDSIKTTELQASNDFRFASAVAYFGQILRKSSFKGTYSVQQVIALADGARGADSDGKRHEFVELVKNAAALLP